MNLFQGIFQNRQETVIQVLLIIGIFGCINYLADKIFLRFDLTENNRYTLSDASRDIAAGISDPVTVTAYFSGDLPPQLAIAEDEFRNFLDEFRAVSGGNLEFRFLNPNESDQAEAEAQQAGIRPVMIDVRERDQISQKRAYLGALFQYNDKREVLPVIQPGASLEYSIASTIKKLTIDQKPQIGFLQGHGQPTLNAMIQAVGELREMYNVTEVAGIDTAGVPPENEVLVIAAPRDEFSTDELVAIDQYIMSGGKVIFALNRVDVQVQTGSARPLETGLEKLLDAYRLPVNTDLVRDVQSSAIQVRQQQGPFTMINDVQYPYIPLISNFSGHPVSDGLDAVVFQFVSSIDTTLAEDGQKITVLAESSGRAGTSTGFYDLDPMKEWQESDFTEARIPLAVVIEGEFKSAFAGVDTIDVDLEKSSENEIIVFGDGDFIINGESGQQQRLPQSNINLLVNAVDWLADDTGLISLRTKGVTARPIEPVDDGTKTLLKYLNVFLPIAFAGGYGLVRYRRRKQLRRQWMEDTEG